MGCGYGLSQEAGQNQQSRAVARRDAKMPASDGGGLDRRQADGDLLSWAPHGRGGARLLASLLMRRPDYFWNKGWMPVAEIVDGCDSIARAMDEHVRPTRTEREPVSRHEQDNPTDGREGSEMSDREDKLAEAAGPSAYYIFPVVIGDDGEEDFATPIRQARREDAIVNAMSLQAQHNGLLVVACYGPPLELEEGKKENFFYHIATIGTVSEKLRRSFQV